MNVMTDFFIYSEAHYKTCPIELREAMASHANPEKVRLLLRAQGLHDVEFVTISTCNRFAICFFGALTTEQIRQLYCELVCSHVLLNVVEEQNLRAEIISCIQIHANEQALKTLFKVAASLDSLVVGEPQIFGQVKESFFKCTELGYAHARANLVFSQAFRVAKKIRNETEIGRNSVSIGHAAVEVAFRHCTSFLNKKILIFGAGEMARITAQYLLSRGVENIFIANRTFANAQKLAHTLGKHVTALPFAEAFAQLVEFEVCFLATAGSGHLITAAYLEQAGMARSGKEYIYVDVCVPRKVDPSVQKFANIILYNVDNLDSIMEKNRSLRVMASERAEKMIEAEVRSFLSSLEQKKNLSNVGRFHAWLNSAINEEVERYFYDVSLGKKTNRKYIARAVSKKVTARCAALARNKAQTPQEALSVGELLELLFELPQSDEQVSP